MVRDITMAAFFGTDASVAAFFVAFRLAHLLRRLFGEGALQSAFIPLFEGLKHDNPKRAESFYRAVTFALTKGLVAIIAIAMTLIWVTGYLSNPVLHLTFLMLPSLLFICLFGVNAALLQCEKRFFLTGFAPAMFNLVWIAGIFWIGDANSQEAMVALSGVIVMACIAQWAMTLPGTCSMLQGSGSDDLKRLGKPLFLGICGVAATQVNNALDGIFALYADLEGPAYLWYAIRIQQLPLALFGISLAGALLPPLARAVKMGDERRYKEFLRNSIRQAITLMIPLTAILLFLGDSIVSFIYGRGDFGVGSILNTTWCLWGYAVGLLPMVLVQVIAPAYYAKGNYKTPMIASTWAVGCNILLNGLFVLVLGWGAVSIAIATCISAWLNLALLTHRLKALSIGEVNKFLTPPLIVVFLGSFSVYLLDTYLLKMSVFQRDIEQIGAFLGRPLWEKGGIIALESSLFAIFWLILHKFVRIFKRS